jgi:hydrogenase maturation protein HypF
MKGKTVGSATRILVFGVVQGVGFRPFVFGLARRWSLKGWVKNIGDGVEIHIEGGTRETHRKFLAALRTSSPPLARIEKVEAAAAPVGGCRGFTIRATKTGGSFVFISPDVATCPECLKEIRTPGERRFQYPFTNCTNCGPRYTIVLGLPYDRSRTTMSGFGMCADCLREYGDPLDRRHHAQPIACPACGPRVTLRDAKTGKTLPGGILEAAALIREGRILAVKGLGGFHLVCDPINRSAVLRLRRTKARKTKPLALMARDVAVIEKHAFVNPEERRLLLSSRRPIVLLRKKGDIPLIAPHLNEIGFMLPYTPLHHLLLEPLGLIVATSSNLRDAPIMKDETEGIRRLADAVLTHNRPIAMRADDSVAKIAAGGPLFIRRARGYVPHPQAVPEGLRSDCSLVALGGELKDTVSVYRNGYVVTSQFLGDLDDYRNFGYFEETLAHLERLFGVRPEAVITDLNPDFRTTRYAAGLGIPHLRVQHHFAHILAPLLEHGVMPGKKVLGVALDGYGYGEDGTAWGGEFLLADYLGFERLARFKPVPLPGGDLAAREPWRMALAYLSEACGSGISGLPALRKIGAAKMATVLGMIRRGVRSPLTSSCGRLFDALSFLCGTSPKTMEYEAEAAMKFEAAAASGTSKSYPVNFSFPEPGRPGEISFAPLIRAVVRDLEKGVAVSRIASAFHNSLARLIVRVAADTREEHGTDTVVLAGGVFLNRILLERTTELLARDGFRVLRPVLYSPNDESLSLGQIAWGLANLKKGGRLTSAE